MKNIKYLFSVILLLVVNGCEINNQKTSKQVIDDLKIQFPQLLEGKSNKDGEFKLVRTVIDDKDNFKVQLYSQKEELDCDHKIIVIINKRNKCFAIPFFNNRHRDYWSFSNDKLIPNVKKINSTFEKEFNTVYREIKIDSDIHKDTLNYSNVINALFVSALQSQNFDSSLGLVDSAKARYAVWDIPIENEDSVKIRFEKNIKEMRKDVWEVSKYVFYYDFKGHRIYRLNYNFEKKVFEFRTYRQDMGIKKIEPIYL